MSVSLIIPVFRVAAYIERCLLSVMNQTMSDFECLIIDDKTDDDSLAIINRLLTGYTGPIDFRIISHPENKGLSEARNTGIKAANREYLFFLDGDDELTADCLQVFAEAARQYPNASIVQGSTAVIRGAKTDRMYQLNKKLPDFTADINWLRPAMYRRTKIPVTSWNKLIKKSFITAHHLYFKPGIRHEDEHWTFFAASYIDSMAFCKQTTYYHYIRPASIMTSAVEKSIESWFSIISDFVSQFDDTSVVQEKVILEVGFCNLIRMVKNNPAADQATIRQLVDRQKTLLTPLYIKAKQRHQLVILWLLRWYTYPLFVLQILCTKHIRGIYFNTLAYLA